MNTSSEDNIASRDRLHDQAAACAASTQTDSRLTAVYGEAMHNPAYH